MHDILEDAHAVLFPVLLDVALDDHIRRFLDCGGRSLLFGETGEEYVSGVMSPERRAVETEQRWILTSGQAVARAGPLITALDADVSAVHRLQGLVPPLPSLADVQAMADADVEDLVETVARSARDLGITMFLSPTADVADAATPWIGGRTLGSDVATVTRLVRAYVRGCQRGGVVSALKHFPGNSGVTGIPATDAEASVPGDWAALAPMLAPFQAGIDAGAGAVLMSPARYDATSPKTAGSLSPELYTLLRHSGFTGLAITSDIDHRATIQDKSQEDVAVAALVAGADLLLLSAAGARRIPETAAAIHAAVDQGSLPRERLAQAAASVRRVADAGVDAGLG